MAENLLTSSTNPETKEEASAAMSVQTTRPTGVPEKFWDSKKNSIRVEDLLKSYLELERKLSSSDPSKNQPTTEQIRKMLGVPESHECYSVKCDHGLFEPDGEINKRMHAMNFNPEQVQFVYDLAAERMIPIVYEVAAQFEADKEISKLKDEFGGEESWCNMARQILAWGRRNLPAAAVEGMSKSYDGVMAMYNMMKNGIDAPMSNSKVKAVVDEEPEKLLKDPRYWRDRNPEFVAKVTEAFRSKYGIEDDNE